MSRFSTMLARFLAAVVVVAILLPVCTPAYAQISAAPHAPKQNSFFTLTPAADQPQPPAVGSAAPPSEPETTEIEPQESFGAKTLNWMIDELERARAQEPVITTDFSAMPEFEAWFEHQSADTKHQNRWNAIYSDLLLIVGIPLLAAIALEFLLMPVRNNLRRRKPDDFSSKLGVVFALFGVKLVPVLLFLGSSLALLDEGEPEKVARYVILNIIYALALSRVLLAVWRALLSPRISALRLIPAFNSQAIYAHRWLRAFTLVIIYGYFIIDIARTVFVPAAVIDAFGAALGFVLVLMTITVIIQKRAFVARVLRGRPPEAPGDISMFGSLRQWFARQWHILAIGYLVIGYGITVFGVENGFGILLRGTIVTLLTLVTMRLVFQATRHWGARDTSAVAAVHHAILRFLLNSVAWVFAALGVAAGWGVNIPALFATPFGQRLIGAAFSIGSTVIVVVLLYEIFSVRVARRLNQRDADGKPVPASARVRTLLPMLRNIVFVLFSAIVALVALYEAGVNIGPLLALSGVVGVAVGFGSQSLVKDFLTGLFIVIENVIAVGDRVKVGDYFGLVESISFRTVRLRDWDGALHILPFSEVSKITNFSKDFAYAQVNTGVAYDSDLEHVMQVMREVCDEVQKDSAFKRAIIEPIEIQGVDNLGDYSITIAARIRVRPGKQWDVRRMYLLRLKQRFDKEGIEIPYPTAVRISKSGG